MLPDEEDDIEDLGLDFGENNFNSNWNLVLYNNLYNIYIYIKY